VHAGFAIDKVDEAEAQKTMDLLQELARLEQEAGFDEIH
jgi:hydrogenase maturation factor